MVHTAVHREVKPNPREERVRSLFSEAKKTANEIVERHHGQASSEALLEVILMEAFLAGFQRGALSERRIQSELYTEVFGDRT